MTKSEYMWFLTVFKLSVCIFYFIEKLYSVIT